MARSHDLMAQVNSLFAQADNENRELTDEERSKANRLLEMAKSHGELEKVERSLAGDGPQWQRGVEGVPFGKGPGDAFIQSKETGRSPTPAHALRSGPRAPSRSIRRRR
jgi:hypothetical protein